MKNIKRLTLILCFALLLCLIFTLTAFASDDANPDENIAGQYVSLSKTTDAWNVDAWALVDGDRSTGTSAFHHTKYTEITVTFDRDIVFGKLVVVSNSKGSFSSTGAYFPEKTNFTFWFSIQLLDENGKVVVDIGNRVCGSKDENENGEIIIDLSNKLKPARSIRVSMDAGWNNQIGLWELEAYEHKCSYDSIKETYMEATCLENGNALFECACGATKHDLIPALGYHTYDSENPEIKYENSILQYGNEYHHCKTCDDYLQYTVSPLFKFLGYSVNYNGTSICVGYSVDKEAISAYEKANGVSLKYGAIISTQRADAYIDSSARLLTTGIKKETQALSTRRFDIRLTTSDWSKIADYEFAMCAYVIEDERVTYLCSEGAPQNDVTLVSYNRIINPPPIASEPSSED